MLACNSGSFKILYVTHSSKLMFHMKDACCNFSGGLSAAETLCRVHGYPTSTSRRNSILVREDTALGTGSTHLRYVGTAAANQVASAHNNKCTADLHRSCFCVRFIAEHTRLKEESMRVNFYLLTHQLFDVIDRKHEPL